MLVGIVIIGTVEAQDGSHVPQVVGSLFASVADAIETFIDLFVKILPDEAGGGVKAGLIRECQFIVFRRS
jgi:hypothetical protein